MANPPKRNVRGGDSGLPNLRATAQNTSTASIGVVAATFGKPLVRLIVFKSTKPIIASNAANSPTT